MSLFFLWSAGLEDNNGAHPRTISDCRTGKWGSDGKMQLYNQIPFLCSYAVGKCCVACHHRNIYECEWMMHRSDMKLGFILFSWWKVALSRSVSAHSSTLTMSYVTDMTHWYLLDKKHILFFILVRELMTPESCYADIQTWWGINRPTVFNEKSKCRSDQAWSLRSRRRVKLDTGLIPHLFHRSTIICDL